MISSGPFALTLGQAVTVTAGATVGVSFDAVILSNHSPMACAVDIGGPAKWLQPWSADLYPLPPGDSVAVTPRFTDQSGSTAGNLTADWYSGGEKIPGSYPTSLFSEAVTAAVSGSVTALTPEFSFTNSPWTPNTVNVSQTFTFSAASPAITGAAVTYWRSGGRDASAQIIVTGATTGNIYLNTIADHGQWVFPFSNLIEPGGLTVALNQVNGDASAKTNTVSVVGLTSPEFVRTLAGPGVPGPDTFIAITQGAAGNTNIAGTGSRTNVIRVWNVAITIDAPTAGTETSATLAFGGTNFLICRCAGVGNNQIAQSYPTGIALSLFLNPLNFAVAANGNATVHLAYSQDCA